MTERHEASEAPAAMLAKGRRKARAALEAVKPELRKATEYSANLATQVYGKKAFQILDALVDDAIAPEDWLGDLMTLAIEHWLQPLEALAQLFTKKATPVPTKDVHFTIDYYSQAADPVAIDVSDVIHNAMKRGRVITMALETGTQTIPAEHLRYTVSEGITYISLVGLRGLGLQPGPIQAPIRIILAPDSGIEMPDPIMIGTAHLTIDNVPPNAV